MNKNNIGFRAQEIMAILNASATSKQWEELTGLINRMVNQPELKLSEVVKLLKKCDSYKTVRVIERNDEPEGSYDGDLIGRLHQSNKELIFGGSGKLTTVEDLLQDCEKFADLDYMVYVSDYEYPKAVVDVRMMYDTVFIVTKEGV